MDYDLPTPAELGLGSKFNHWRKAQYQAVMSVVDDEHRFTGCLLPTGSGKTLIPMAVAAVTGKRVLVLTRSKALQDQAIEDHGHADLMVDARGRNNFECHAEGARTCEDGAVLGCQSCPYRDQMIAAKQAQVVVGNYSHWFAIRHSDLNFGKFDYLFVDEAHAAPDEVSDAASLSFSTSEVYKELDMRWPRDIQSMSAWRSWAHEALKRVTPDLESLDEIAKSGAAGAAELRELHRLKRFERRLLDLTEARGYWVVEGVKSGHDLNLFWPDAYAERILFRGTPRVVFMSATLTAKTIRLLGVEDHDRSYRAWPFQFPVESCPVIPVPGARIRYNARPDEIDAWVRAIDEIIGMNLDRKGLVHTVSYRWAREIVARSKHRRVLMTHKPPETARTVSRFKSSFSPRYLVSPVVGTGYDFPGPECEVNIIAKLPFPDATSRIIKARQEDDEDYGPHLMAQTLAQSIGRGMRSSDDRCTTYIVDENLAWAYPKFRSLFTAWVHDLMRAKHHRVPPPPPPLAGGNRGEHV